MAKRKAEPISTRNLAPMPEIELLRQRMQQMAALESVFLTLLGEGVGVFEFHPKWKRSEQMGAAKDGSGDELFVHFTPAGCFIKGFAHESEMTPYKKNPPALWPGLFSGVPAAFASSLKEPAFDIPASTFAVWRLKGDTKWQADKIKYPNDYDCDGSRDLLSYLTFSADEFTEWLAENFETEVDAEIVASVFENRPLSDDQLRSLNPSRPVATLRKVVKETGYPLAG
jgi:hypothetical protein